MKKSAANPTDAIGLRHYLPIDKHRLLAQFKQEPTFTPSALEPLDGFFRKLERLFYLEFFELAEQLKQAYAPYDPDAPGQEPEPSSSVDTGCVDAAPGAALDAALGAPKLSGDGSNDHSFSDQSLSDEKPATPTSVGPALITLLQRANYFQLSPEQIRASLQAASLFNIRLDVNFDDFEEALVFCRGESVRTETVTHWLRWKKQVTFVNYDRVVLFLRLKQHAQVEGSEQLLGRRGRTLLKLFKDVPRGDLEMLFPNTRIGMRLRDKLLIGVPAFVSGAVVLATKMSASLLLLSGLVGFWLGYNSKPQSFDANALLILVTSFAAVAGYIWKQFSNFKNRKLKFAQALTKNLYFKSLDNNSGVFYRVIQDAQEQEYKEAAIAYFVLLSEGKPLLSSELDRLAERWLEACFAVKADFDATDALAKLERLGLVAQAGSAWQACDITQASQSLDRQNMAHLSIALPLGA